MKKLLIELTRKSDGTTFLQEFEADSYLAVLETLSSPPNLFIVGRCLDEQPLS